MPFQRPFPVALTRFAVFTALATVGLIGLGGLVTSHGVGMAVPDWPTTYGYNMFLFPVSQWVGGIFYEHTHRLYASAVGLLTVVLALWLQWRSPNRALVKWGWVALGLVMVQGLLGGLRVSLMIDSIGIFHAALAQLFLVLLTLIALGTSRRWGAWLEQGPAEDGRTSRWVTLATVLIFAQLMLGATMRHQHAGLAVPDFPLAYGQLWPPTDAAFLDAVNARRSDVRDFHPITAFHVQMHMAHRWGGVLLAVIVSIAALKMRRAYGAASGPGRLGTVWMTLLCVQVLLGASTVWFNKAADVATAHVVTGAACLVIGAISAAMCRVAAKRAVPGRAAGQRMAASGAAVSDRSVALGAG